jgi:hypothetical protein
MPQESFERAAGAGEIQGQVIETARAGSLQRLTGQSGFFSSQISHRSTFKIGLDAINNRFSCDQMHAVGQSANNVNAKTFGFVFDGAIPQRTRARLPTTTFAAARQRPNRVQKLMAWVGFPLWWFAAASDDHARSKPGTARRARHCSRQMHKRGHTAEHSLGIVH